MPSRTIVATNADGSTRNIVIPDRSRYAGVRTIDRNDGTTLTINRTASTKNADRAGESRPLLSKVVGGAAAAYSLRDLNDKAGNNKVVRVRRESDNNERDFLAKEVSNGTLQNWVNTQATLPLDLQTLTADGRTGSVIGAQAAYSLRNLSSSYSGAVVNVRRSSDDTTRDFTADEVSNGTLEAFVNENQVHYASDYSSGLNSWVLKTNNWTGSASWSHNATNDNRLAVTATATPSGAKRPALQLTRPSNILVGQQYSMELDYEVISGTPVLLGNNFGGADYSHNETLSGSGTATIAPAGFNAGTPFIYFDGENHTFELSIKAFRFKSTVANGFVTTWYDQSGNSNNATQGTDANQPKIVENGYLVSGGVLFTGASEGLQIASASTLGITGSTNRSIISVIKTPSGTDGFIPFGNDSASGTSTSYRHRSSNTSGLSRIEIQGSGFEGADVSDGNTHLFSSILNGTQLQNVSIFVDGSETAGVGTATLNTANNNFFIGSITGSLSENTGTLAELIVYDTDQTDNRTALEANIAERYGISGVPTATDTVNGFVEAWYDQSGNGLDAEQTSSSEQPLIVINGTLNANGIKFDGVDDYLDIGGTGSNELGIVNPTPLSIYTVQQPSYKAVIGDNSNRLIRLNPYTVQFYATVQNVVETWATVLPLNDLAIFSINHGGTGTTSLVRMRANGENASTSSVRQGTTHANTANSPIEYIGKNQGNAAQDRFEKSIKELIIYKSDQALNTPAIEANIANQYGITLL